MIYSYFPQLFPLPPIQRCVRACVRACVRTCVFVCVSDGHSKFSVLRFQHSLSHDSQEEHLESGRETDLFLLLNSQALKIAPQTDDTTAQSELLLFPFEVQTNKQNTKQRNIKKNHQGLFF